MCDPVSIGIAVVGAVMQSNAQKRAFNAAADAANKQADEADAIATQNAKIARTKAAALRSRQRASFIKSGVQMQGTPEAVLAQTTRDEELNALAILSSGQMSAEVARQNARSRAAEGSAAQTGAILSIASTAVSQRKGATV